MELKVVDYARKTTISDSPEFEKKGLATHACNVGVQCGHFCKYCSTPSMNRTQTKNGVYEEIQMTPCESFNNEIAILDSDTPERIKQLTKKFKKTDTIIFCSLTDGWSPEAQMINLGRNTLQAILESTQAKVRILTKNAAVRKDFDLIEHYKDRIELSLSITSPPSKSHLIEILEPNASPISERIDVLQNAHQRGIKVYGMLCPCLPGIADNSQDFGEMLDLILPLEPINIWTEPLNGRSQALLNCENALFRKGYNVEAGHFYSIRSKNIMQTYVHNLIKMVTETALNRNCLDRLRILVYGDKSKFDGNDSAVVWLGKQSKGSTDS